MKTVIVALSKRVLPLFVRFFSFYNMICLKLRGLLRPRSKRKGNSGLCVCVWGDGVTYVYVHVYIFVFPFCGIIGPVSFHLARRTKTR